MHEWIEVTPIVNNQSLRSRLSGECDVDSFSVLKQWRLEDLSQIFTLLFAKFLCSKAKPN